MIRAQTEQARDYFGAEARWRREAGGGIEAEAAAGSRAQTSANRRTGRLIPRRYRRPRRLLVPPFEGLPVDYEIRPEPTPLEREALAKALERLLAGDPTPAP